MAEQRGRPKDPAAKSESVQVRLRPDQMAALDRIVEKRAEKLRGQGVEVTRTTVLRSLLEQAIEADEAEDAALARAVVQEVLPGKRGGKR